MLEYKDNIIRMLITILILLVSISCTTTNTALIEEVSIVPKNVEIVITTNIPEFDEIFFPTKVLILKRNGSMDLDNLTTIVMEIKNQ